MLHMTNKSIHHIIIAAITALAAALHANAHEKSIAAFLDRIGGEGASERFVTALDPSLSANTGHECFTISSSDGKPSISGSTLSALTTGIGWYLNHYAHINLTWNNPRTDLVSATLPLPSEPLTHCTGIDYRYYLNYCTFSYSMSTFTWDRWQQEIDWMALHGINLPLQIVGLDAVWKRMLTSDYGYTPEEADAFIAGPCFQAWWGMNNLEGWGGPNPEWWYERQEALARNIIARERELGIEPVLPGFAGTVPSTFTEKTGIASLNQGGWCGFVRPDLLDPTSEAFPDVASSYYRHLEQVMGPGRYYSMDPFHEGANISAFRDKISDAYLSIYNAMDAAAPDSSKWVIQQWQWAPYQYNALLVPQGRLVVLDLFSDGQPRNLNRYRGHETVWCSLPNFGARTGMSGRLATTIDSFFATAESDSCNLRGIGATPEGIEQTPVAYDLLFELPWLEVKPDLDEWIASYSTARYGEPNAAAADAWRLLAHGPYNCPGALQGPHEAIICARPALEINSVSTWGGSELFYDPADVVKAAYLLLDSQLPESANYSYDLTDVTRQALTDYSKTLLADIRAAHEAGDSAAFNALRNRFLQLILDIDELLCTNPDFIIGRWTEGVRAIADEWPGTSDADREWLEKNNARTLITTWGPQIPAEQGGLRDYSYRETGGMLRDFYHRRWKEWFDRGMTDPEGGWFGMEWDWAHNNTTRYPTIPTGSTSEVASRLLNKYFPRP